MNKQEMLTRFEEMKNQSEKICLDYLQRGYTYCLQEEQQNYMPLCAVVDYLKQEIEKEKETTCN